MADEDKDIAEGEDRQDPRLEFLSSYVLKTRRLKTDKWLGMMSKNEYKATVMEFLNEPSYKKLVFMVNNSGHLMAMSDLPENPQTKCSYFIRRTIPTLLTEANIREVLLCGDISPRPIDDLSILVDHVFLPILNNPENHIGWTSSIETDVQIEFQILRNSIAEYKGNMINRTTLPVPITIDDIMSLAPKITEGDISGLTVAMKYSLENVVLNWADILSEFINQTQEEVILLNNLNACPKHLFVFWRNRLENLENIVEQFHSPTFKTISTILEITESVYLDIFKSSFVSVVQAFTQALDVTKHLYPLEKLLEDFDKADVIDSRLPEILLQNLCLIWSNCRHFTKTEPMSFLFKLVCNQIIDYATRNLDSTSIFQTNIAESLNKIEEVSKFLHKFSALYENYKLNLHEFKTKSARPQYWTWYPETVFERFNIFRKRLEDIQDILLKGLQFLQLEKIEIGGLEGRNISREFTRIFSQFENIYGEWRNISFDPLNVNGSVSFESEKTKFNEKISDLEHEMSFQLTKALKDCEELNQILQLIQVLDTLFSHDIIAEKISTPLIDAILDQCQKELNIVKNSYNDILIRFKTFGLKGGQNLYFHINSGALAAVNKLRDRLAIPLKKLQSVEFQVFKTEYGQETIKNINEMIHLLEEFEKELLAKCQDDLERQVSKGLDQRVLRKDGSHIFLNYPDELVLAMKDGKYFQRMNYVTPLNVIDILNREDNFWEAKMKLQKIVEWYNYIMNNTMQCEKDLISEEIKKIELRLEPTFTTISWGNLDQSSIEHIFKILNRLNTDITEAQTNIKSILTSIRAWADVPLYHRKDGISKNLLDIENSKILIENRYMECFNTNEVIKQMLETNKTIFSKLIIESSAHIGHVAEFEADDSNLALAVNSSSVLNRKNFRSYEEYVDELVAQELIRAVLNSFLYIRNEMENRHNNENPIFEIKMELRNDDLAFIPSLDIAKEEGIYKTIETILLDILGMTNVIPRVAQPIKLSKVDELNIANEIYDNIIEKNEEVSKICKDILKKVKLGIIAAQNHLRIFDSYRYLWTMDRFSYLNHFKTYGRGLEEEELQLLGTEEFTVAIKEPTLDSYRMEIEKFNSLYEEVNKWEDRREFDIWLRLDKKHFKSGILKHISNWCTMFKQDLISRVFDTIQEIDTFQKEAISIMDLPITKNDFEGLLNLLSVIKKVNDNQFKYERMIEPLPAVMELLKYYDYEFSDEILIQVQELPSSWMKTIKLAAIVKQQIAPIQSYQVDLLEKRIILFEIRVTIFRKNFLTKPIFRVPYNEPYKMCNQINREIMNLEVNYMKLKESATSFNMKGPDDSKLLRCRKDLKLIKQVWDFLLAIETTIQNYQNTPWKDINVDVIDQECKNYLRELRMFDKDVRMWDPFIYAESILKNLITSLRAVTSLQNPAIRDRHWAELTAATNVTFKMDSSTKLSDLLKLNLHKFEEEVNTIVDKSVKQMGMEKILNELHSVWSHLELNNEIHQRTGAKLLRVPEEIIEILEDHQVQLQNISSSKYIQYFAQEVTNWQTQLEHVEQVLISWLEIQRKWKYLESIFLGSEDIQKQLPEDTKRFKEIDREFKSMLSIMLKQKAILKLADINGIFSILDRLNNLLAICEKSLFDYLETKRLAYPRFYFISSPDLLDILSNENRPDLVGRHLSKMYDSLAKLSMVNGTKKANGMISKEHNELVPFKDHCDCTGKIELWLNEITKRMKTTLRWHFRKALADYEDQPRHVWIFDWQAQPALCTTQISWTSETNEAFKKLDHGYENAMKDFQKKQINQLNILINLLISDLSPGDRQKIMTICTIDVHSRDVVSKLIEQRVDSVSSFQWQSQLRHRWDEAMDDCFVNICDAEFRYDYEYLGNTPRLVITPLTDRCYITLTQSLHLVMGGAPAGPAGTGKTETTKDLGRALGAMVYVFNCSEQMDYRSCANIHKGLIQTGAWGCFDEFNRISVEVLSVVAVQVKSIQDAIKAKKKIFNFMGDMINLISTVGLFITMNPGYAGRTELPENLKTLYRPCAMVVPDFALICEIMLVAEGFQGARLLARKFITLYSLCKELLSKQDHYDWGLRAIKSVLVVAGSLKRDDRFRPEDQVLMRALRDYNIPKILSDDLSVFMGLIQDLFPALDVPRKRNLDFEKIVKQSAMDLNLQPDEEFILKVIQLEELLAVRHSVFIIGNAGTGKTEVWRTLNKTYKNQKRKPVYNDLNPKVVTSDELFGVVNPSTREWTDGLFSIIMRDQANMASMGPKWIVLDGDIDPMWIESLNTVMDDNKILTLASNERIPLTKEMRLLFEIFSLVTATPATVSRAGILYINQDDLGWNAYVSSWINSRSNEMEKSILNVLYEKYVPPVLEIFRTRMKTITPISEISMITMTCHLLDSLLIEENISYDSPKEWYEIYFVFSIIWGFGSALFQDEIIDWRNEFHKWWINEFKTIKFPTNGKIFDFYIDRESKKFIPWSLLVQEFILEPEIPLYATMVDTKETVILKYFQTILIEKGCPIMLVGPTGSGKSVIMSATLDHLPEEFVSTKIPFNFYTSSDVLQKLLEKPLEKKAGRNFGPLGTKRMIYFIDDFNMPEVDKYETVLPHTLIRQFMDYRHWYDKSKFTLKDIQKCQFVACMNPSAGSFTINPRLQRHFCTFTVSPARFESLQYILHSILSQHLSFPHNKFHLDTQGKCDVLVKTAIALHQKVVQTFLPTAVKFHYNFNLRDITNIFTGMLFATSDTCPTPDALLRLWLHEASRVYGDKLVDNEDINLFEKLSKEIMKRTAEIYDDSFVFSKPLIYWHFSEGLTDSKYMPVDTWEQLKNVLTEALVGYNEIVSSTNLVMFEDAMTHICRISRLLEGTRGCALLIGVGGSGKQSLTRLGCYISSLEVIQPQITKDYGILDLKAEISKIYIKAGLKSLPCCFLMTDSQVTQEEFLVLVNDMLASGEIHELFADDDIDSIVKSLRNEVKQMGVLDSRDNCWKYFIDKVRRLLKIVLCFSPVGTTLRTRARKFPAIINSTTIDWFHEWPKEALESVSLNFVSGLEILPENQKQSVAKFMAYVHGTVNDMSRVYLLNEKRYNYTTPKTFLELIGLYSKLLKETTVQNTDRVFRLENGLKKLISCSKEVDGLQTILQEQEIVLKSKNETADKLISLISAENEKIETERAFIYEEEHKVRTIEEDVTEKAKLCEEDLRRAQPALIAAQNALNTLNKNNLTELKSFGNPPDAVVSVCAAVLILFSPKGKIPRDLSWKACKILMGKLDKFLDDLINYDKEHIQPETIKALQPFLTKPQFNPDEILKKSSAAAGLCAWVININKFYEVFQVVEPKQKALLNAEKDLKSARNKLISINNRLKELEDKLNSIRLEYDAALTEKEKVKTEADQTAFTIDLAHRLITGLSSEKVRWKDTILTLEEQKSKLPGDILLISCFISYVGGFTKLYRIELQTKFWLPAFRTIDPAIPSSENLDPFDMICDEVQIAEWNNEGLPTDSLSAENAAILLHSERYPLIIDPQLQGIKWIKTKFAENLLITRLSDKSYMKLVEEAITNGAVLLIEDISEKIDGVLEPILCRNLIKQGTYIIIGDREVKFNKNFRLILQTKLSNPHFKPELQAQTTLINFTVTQDGLEEQLLGEVVKAERSDLEEIRSKLIRDQNNFKITLKYLEDDLLQRLLSAGENILADTDLILNLEKTKLTADKVENKVRESQATAIELNSSRNFYRPVAKRAAVLYFVLNDLIKMNPLYQYSLKAFIDIFQKALNKAPPAKNNKDRLLNLIDSVTFSVHAYTLRGLFERDKMVFMFHMTIQILYNDGDVDYSILDFLLKCPSITELDSPVSFLSDLNWRRVKALSNLSKFQGLDKDIEGSHKRWKTFVNAECPENEKLPGEWKTKPLLEKLCIMRTLRPDRMVHAAKAFIAEKLGSKYVNSRITDFETAFEETTPSTYVFFILSPGVDPLQIVETIGKKLGFTVDNGSLHSISLGQGQETLAENALDIAAENGHWVVLQNIHLVAKWLPNLEKKLQSTEESAHKNYRLFLSAEPAPSAEYHVIPQGILNCSIKITNEPPSGMSSNIHKAIDNFSQETLEMCSKETEFKAILFSLCYFHAVVSERQKFGPQGWNHYYPFNFGDLTISVFVLYNYLELNTMIPWDDLKYLFGEIIYGGHITDNWDRRLCKTYLEEYMHQNLVDGELLFCEGFPVPQNMNLEEYHTYVDEILPPEHPLLYGLHSNTDIGFLTNTSERLFKTVSELQPQTEGRISRGVASKEVLVKDILEDMLDKIPVAFILSEIMSRIEYRSPYDTVFLQECERMNILMNKIKTSLMELNLGLKGELTLSENMEFLMDSLLQDHIPKSWSKLAYPSTYNLQDWFADLLIRLQQLESWISDLHLPLTIWLGGFFNPQSFLTAIMQETSRKNQSPLDGMCLVCEVTKKRKEEISSIPREGVYVNGLFMEGARWDAKLGTIADARLKELFPPMPVIYIKAVTQDNQDIKNIYECPIYRTRMRGPTYVWTFNLKTKEKPSKWTLAGVCLLLQP